VRLAHCELLRDNDFLGASPDESEGHMSIHMYLVDEQFERRHVFIGLPKIHGKPDGVNLSKLFIDTLSEKASLSKTDLCHKLVAIAADGACVLQGQLSGLIVRGVGECAPHAVDIWCAAHRLNLGAKDFGKQSMVVSVGGVVTGCQGFFSRSDYRCDLLNDTQELLGMPTNKLLRDIVTRWLSQAAPWRRHIEQYSALLVFFDSVQTMLLDAAAHAQGLHNQLTDLDNYLSLLLLQPLMDELESTVKLLQSRV
jgi:hypothetical protein